MQPLKTNKKKTNKKEKKGKKKKAGKEGKEDKEKGGRGMDESGSQFPSGLRQAKASRDSLAVEKS